MAARNAEKGFNATPKRDSSVSHKPDPEHQTPVFRPIGVIRTPFLAASGTPIQPNYADKHVGTVVVDNEFVRALHDLEGFDHIWLLYILDRAGPYQPLVVPYRDNKEHGLFSTRSPCRPNPIGLSVVKLVERDKNNLTVRGIDVLDNTPLLDIKPYVPQFDARPQSKAGWFDTCTARRQVADDRFHQRGK